MCDVRRQSSREMCYSISLEIIFLTNATNTAIEKGFFQRIRMSIRANINAFNTVLNLTTIWAKLPQCVKVKLSSRRDFIWNSLQCVYKARIEISPTAQFISDAYRASSMKVLATGLIVFLITIATVQSFSIQERGLYDQNGKTLRQVIETTFLITICLQKCYQRKSTCYSMVPLFAGC